MPEYTARAAVLTDRLLTEGHLDDAERAELATLTAAARAAADMPAAMKARDRAQGRLEDAQARIDALQAVIDAAKPRKGGR